MVLALIFVAVRFLPDSPAAAKYTPPAVTSRARDTPEHCAQKWHAKKSTTLSAESSLDPTLRYDWLKPARIRSIRVRAGISSGLKTR